MSRSRSAVRARRATTVIGRSYVLSRSVLRGAVSHLTGQSLSEAQRESVVALLADLRGLAVKVSQWLAEEGDLVGPELASALAIAHRDVEAMDDATLDATFLAELGRLPEDLFDEFERTPFAAASIGQVHRARRAREGRLAVKVQFPSLAETIRSDLRVLAGAMSVVPWARPHRRILAEVRARFHEELDYGREARQLAAFRARLEPLGVLVPASLPELSSSRVLVMEYVAGEPVLAWARTASRVDIDAVASLALRVWNLGFTQHRWIHGDPSPGNLLVHDGALRLIDLGCVREISPPVAALVSDLISEPERAGTGATLRRYESLGVLGGDGRAAARAIYDDMLAPLERWLAGPARPGGLDFRAEPDWPARGRAELARLIRSGDALGVHEEFVLLFRSYYALFRLFQHMGARVRP